MPAVPQSFSAALLRLHLIMGVPPPKHQTAQATGFKKIVEPRDLTQTTDIAQKMSQRMTENPIFISIMFEPYRQFSRIQKENGSKQLTDQLIMPRESIFNINYTNLLYFHTFKFTSQTVSSMIKNK